MNFEHIYDQHKDLVYNLALQYVQNIEDAEEITQDVFVSVYEKMNEFRQEAKPSTWIYRITINRCLDYIKAKKRKKRFAFISSLFGLSNQLLYDSADFNHPGILMEEQDKMKLLFKLINELSHNQKTAIILLKIEEKSQAEAAEIMNISVKALESLFQRAKNNLSKKMKDNEGFG